MPPDTAATLIDSTIALVANGTDLLDRLDKVLKVVGGGGFVFDGT